MGICICLKLWERLFRLFCSSEHACSNGVNVTNTKLDLQRSRSEPDVTQDRNSWLTGLMGESTAMQDLKRQIIKAAPMDVPVLLIGESGTGKEIAARAIHQLSLRSAQALLTVSAAVLSAAQVVKELFISEACPLSVVKPRSGERRLEQAHGGSLFLDEIGDMPIEGQLRLLQLVEDGTYRCSRTTELRCSSLRLICSSSRDLKTRIAEGAFRPELFYRIDGITIRLPALRDRLEDVPHLAEVAARSFAQRHGLLPKRLSLEAVYFLQAQRWPGNVRQLIRSVERAAIFSETDTILPADFQINDAGQEGLQAHFSASQEPAAVSTLASQYLAARSPAKVKQQEERIIREALHKFNGNKLRAAAELGISRSYLYKRLAQMGL